MKSVYELATYYDEDGIQYCFEPDGNGICLLVNSETFRPFCCYSGRDIPPTMETPEGCIVNDEMDR